MNSGVSYFGVIGDSALVWNDVVTRRRIEIRPIAGGASRRIALIGESNEWPVWSPDGKRLAFRVWRGRNLTPAVINADGTNLQSFSDHALRPGMMGPSWSPDGKSIAFPTSGHRAVAVDVTTRESVVLLDDSTVQVGRWAWTPDGRAIRALVMRQNGPPRGAVEELSLNGNRRKLFDFSALNLPQNTSFVLSGAATLFYRADSVAYSVNLDGGGAPRRLSAVPPATILMLPTASADGKLVAGALWSSQQPERNQLELFSMETGTRRLLEVPFRFAPGAQMSFDHDGRAILAVGRPARDTTGLRLYRVPLDGTAPREISRLGDISSSAAASVSPDGNLVAYTVQESRTVSLLLVDLRGGAPSPASRVRR
jgi:Tol biopolymer transport system component